MGAPRESDWPIPHITEIAQLAGLVAAILLSGYMAAQWLRVLL